MTGLIILLATLLFDTLFLSFSAEGEYRYFPFSDMELNPQSYVYFLVEHINKILVPIGVYLARNHIRPLFIFVCIQFLDTLDYCLTYSNPWFDGPPSFNHIKILLFGLSIIFEKYGR